MSKNGLLAALYTLGITLVVAGVFWLAIVLIKYYPEISGYIFTGCIAGIVFMIFVHPLWEGIKNDLDNGDTR